MKITELKDYLEGRIRLMEIYILDAGDTIEGEHLKSKLIAYKEIMLELDKESK